MKEYNFEAFMLRLSFDGGNIIFELQERTAWLIEENGANKFQVWTRGYLYIPAGNFISTIKTVVKCWLSAYDLKLADFSETFIQDYLSDPNNLITLALPPLKTEAPPKPNLN